MSTFRQMNAMELLYADRDHKTTPGGIRGLKGVEFDRAFKYNAGRTKAGYQHKHETPWDAHGQLHQFKEIASVDKAMDPGDKHLTVQVNFTDGTHTYVQHDDLFVVEDPITV